MFTEETVTVADGPEEGKVYNLKHLVYDGPSTSEGKPPQKDMIKFGEAILDQVHILCEGPDKIKAASRWNPETESWEGKYDQEADSQLYLCGNCDTHTVRDWFEAQLAEAEDIVMKYREKIGDIEEAESLVKQYWRRKTDIESVLSEIILQVYQE